MVTCKMILEAKKRFKSVMKSPLYKNTLAHFSKQYAKKCKASLFAKILNDIMDDEAQSAAKQTYGGRHDDTPKAGAVQGFKNRDS